MTFSQLSKIQEDKKVGFSQRKTRLSKVTKMNYLKSKVTED